METQDVQGENVTTRSTGIRYGLILAAISIVWFVIMNVAGLDMQGPAGYCSWLFTGVVLFFAHKFFKEKGDGFMTIGQGIGISFWAGLISSVLSSIFTYIYVKFIDTGFLDAIKDKQMQGMQEKGMSDEQIEQAMKIAGMFTTPEAMIVFGIVFGILGAFIIGLLISLFTKNTNPDTAI